MKFDAFRPTHFINVDSVTQLHVMIAYSQSDAEKVAFTCQFDKNTNRYTSSVCKSYLHYDFNAVYFERHRVRFYLADMKPLRK